MYSAAFSAVAHSGDLALSHVLDFGAMVPICSAVTLKAPPVSTEVFASRGSRGYARVAAAKVARMVVV